jgi:F-type H+-transporting ATPase subunit epsilon
MMPAALHLTITTPEKILVDAADVASVRADDQSGSFGVLAGHADLLTVLVPCVVRWRTADGVARFCAVRGGVFTVSGGDKVALACREGVVDQSLDELQRKVREVRAQQTELDRKARAEEVRVHALAIRQLMRYLRPNPATAFVPLAPGPAA